MESEIPFVLLLVLLTVSAGGALLTRDILTSVLLLSVFGLVSTVVFAFLQAVDVALAEAVIGAGLLTAMFVTVIAKTRRSP